MFVCLFGLCLLCPFSALFFLNFHGHIREVFAVGPFVTLFTFASLTDGRLISRIQTKKWLFFPLPREGFLFFAVFNHSKRVAFIKRQCLVLVGNAPKKFHPRLFQIFTLSSPATDKISATSTFIRKSIPITGLRPTPLSISTLLWSGGASLHH